MEHPRELVAQAAKHSKFKPESLEFTLRGLCPECVKGNGNAEFKREPPRR
jgi:Fe2+ or Zn2+ uptake regulation protein